MLNLQICTSRKTFIFSFLFLLDQTLNIYFVFYIYFSFFIIYSEGYFTVNILTFIMLGNFISLI